MMATSIDSIERLKTIFSTQKLAVLATQEIEGPYLSLMALAWTEDLSHIMIATRKGTRKYSNIMKSPQVALLIDNRSVRGEDFQNTMAVTALGEVMKPALSETDFLTSIFLGRHPDLELFVRSPECVVLKVQIKKYIIISRFEEAEELLMG
ncbi:MAG: pyridoxamine 5'-phosphate oxidase family protein [Thermodesulfobacteriota bacterium]